ncbi:Transporter [Candidatus Paraburkholderia kirkii]|nr:Transporter [Candidatus Paraburkholderia kirkii]
MFLLIAVVGLFYVKWFPYYNRVFVAASQHAIGKSILMGTAASAPQPSWQAALDYAMAYGRAIWQAMVLGLLLGSAVQALIPPRWVARALGRNDFGSVLNGGLMSLPGMMCTCCAALAFWLGNTVLNLAALVFMGFVLGWQWTGLRLALGVPMVFGLDYAVNRMVTPAQAAASRAALAKLIEEDEPGTAFSRWIGILGRMTLRLVPEYVVLVLLLGAARAWLFPHIGPDIGNGMLWIAAFAVAGTLFVIPTAGEVPIIQAMLSLGMAAGPAGALLMTLPPVSVPSLAMLGRSFSWRVLAFVTIAVIAFGIVGGLIAAALF